MLAELNPHDGHSRLDGNQRLTLTEDRPARSALSSNSRIVQPASATDFASRVRARPDTDRQGFLP
jgi:hypothetical protein